MFNNSQALNKLSEIFSTYPWFFHSSFERTSTLDGDYDEPVYCKTLADAYEIGLEYVNQRFYNRLTEKYEVSVDDSYCNEEGKLCQRTKQIEFKLKSFEETINSKNGEIFKTPDYVIIITGKIAQCKPEEIINKLTLPIPIYTGSSKIIVTSVFGSYEKKSLEIYHRQTEYTIKKTLEGKIAVYNYNKSCKLEKLFNQIDLAVEYIKHKIITKFNSDWLCLFYFAYNQNLSDKNLTDQPGKFLMAEFVDLTNSVDEI